MLCHVYIPVAASKTIYVDIDTKKVVNDILIVCAPFLYTIMYIAKTISHNNKLYIAIRCSVLYQNKCLYVVFFVLYVLICAFSGKV